MTADDQDDANKVCGADAVTATLDIVLCDLGKLPQSEVKDTMESSASCPIKSSVFGNGTEFSMEFADFMRLRRREQGGSDVVNTQEIIYAELSGEWSRTRIYICGACGSRHVSTYILYN
jgi:hypothetical protein